MERRVINPWKWQDAFGFAQAIEVTGSQRTLSCSGQASQDGDGAPIHAGFHMSHNVFTHHNRIVN